jgi:hypothetical protein
MTKWNVLWKQRGGWTHLWKGILGQEGIIIKTRKPPATTFLWESILLSSKVFALSLLHLTDWHSVLLNDNLVRHHIVSRD